MSFINKYKLPILLSAGVFVFGLALLPLFRYGITPDATSYVTIAQKYSEGDFRHAINGYWGPLFSWMIAPAFWLNIDPMLFGKLLLFVAASGIAFTTYVLLRVSTSKKVAAFGSAFAGFVSVSWALYGPITPDLVFALILMLLVIFGTRLINKPSLRNNLVFGILGAFLYFSKPVGFFLFIGAWLVILFGANGKKHSLESSIKYYWVSLVAFLALVLPFVGVLALKYERVVISTSSAYNLSLVGPDSTGHPINNQIIAPPNSTAISAWEDISNAPVVPWKPFSSTEDIKHLASNIADNLEALVSILWKFSFPMLILAVYGFYTLSKNSRQREEKILLAAASLFLVLIYLPLFFEPRYLIFINLVAIIGFCWFIGLFLKINRYHAVLWMVGISAVLIGVFWQVDSLIAKANAGKVVRSDALALQQVVNSQDRVVSDRVDGIYACYYTGAKCYGVVVPSQKSNFELAANEVDYLLLTDKTAAQLKTLGVKLSPIGVVTYLDQKLYRFNP